MAEQNLINQLRDIHYPDPISWWPLAPGWYFLFLLLALIGFLAGTWVYRQRIKRKKRLHILQQLQALQTLTCTEPLTPHITQQLSILLKQVVLLLYPRQEVAGLSGEAWLLFLDQQINTTDFSQGLGRLLITSPYERHAPKEIKALITLVETWVKQQMKKKL